MIKKLLLILILLFAIDFFLLEGEHDILKQSWHFGGPDVPLIGLKTGSIDITMHNYIRYKEIPHFIRVYDFSINTPLDSVSKSIRHQDLVDFRKSLPTKIDEELKSHGFNPPPLYPFEQ